MYFLVLHVPSSEYVVIIGKIKQVMSHVIGIKYVHFHSSFIINIFFR